MGDRFKRAAPAVDRDSTSAAASALLTLLVPPGIVVHPIIPNQLIVGVSVNCTIVYDDAAAGVADTVVGAAIPGSGDTTDNVDGLVDTVFATNTSAQNHFQQINGAGTPSTSALYTRGWIDRRRQDAV